MQYMDYLLCDSLTKYSNIIVYGTGCCAKKIYPALCKRGIDEKINFYVVSSNKSESLFDTFEVKCFDEIEADKANTAVFIAVSDMFQNEIYSKVKSAGFENIISLTDYERTDENLWKVYKELDFSQFCNYILKRQFFLDLNEEVSDSNPEEVFCEWSRRKDFHKNQIVFISGHFTPRSSKIIRSLKKKNIEIIVILYGEYCGEQFADEIKEDGIEYIKCPDEESMTFCMMKYSPLVYYFEPKWGNCMWIKILLSYKQFFRPIVLGLWDVMNDGYVLDNPVLYETEKYALENADGIVWRWFSKEYLEEQKKFVFKGKSIQFHDYCGAYMERIQIPDSSEIDENVLKLCTVQGSFWDFSQKGDVPAGYRGFASLDEIIGIIGKNSKCFLHIFIGRYDDEGYMKGKMIEKEVSNIRFFWNTPHAELIEKLRKYDYGCEFYRDGKKRPLYTKIKCGGNRYYESVNISSVSNRFYDYLDAELPIVSLLPEMQMNYLSKYGAVVRMSLQNFSFAFLIQNKKELKKAAQKAKDMLTADRHINKLIEFFQEL